MAEHALIDGQEREKPPYTCKTTVALTSVLPVMAGDEKVKRVPSPTEPVFVRDRAGLANRQCRLMSANSRLMINDKRTLDTEIAA